MRYPCTAMQSLMIRQHRAFEDGTGIGRTVAMVMVHLCEHVHGVTVKSQVRVGHDAKRV